MIVSGWERTRETFDEWLIIWKDKVYQISYLFSNYFQGRFVAILKKIVAFVAKWKITD